MTTEQMQETQTDDLTIEMPGGDDALPEGELPEDTPGAEMVPDEEDGTTVELSIHEDLEDGDVLPAPTPGKRSKRRTRKRASPTAASREKMAETQMMGFDEWMESYHWEWPGMCVKMVRIAPTHTPHPQTRMPLPVSGYLDTIEGAPVIMETIKRRWGGGVFEAKVIGPRTAAEADAGRRWLLSRKQVRISGLPIVSAAAMPQSDASTPADPTTAGDPHGLAGIAAQAQTGLVGILGDVVRERGRGGGGGDGSQRAFESSVKTIHQSSAAQVSAIKDAAEKEAAYLRTQMEELRQSFERARAEWTAERRALESQTTEASGAAQTLITSVIPTFSENSARQAENAYRAAQDHIRNVQERASSERESSARQYEMQVTNMRSFFEAQMQQMASTSEGQVMLLRAQLENATGRADRMAEENQSLRNSLLLKATSDAKAKDPLEDMQRMAGVMDFAKQLGSGGDGGGLGDDAPSWMQMLNNQLLPAVASVAEAVVATKGGVQPAPGMPGHAVATQMQQAVPQMGVGQPQLQQMPQQQQQQQQQQQLPPGPQAVPPPLPPPPPPQRVKREDLSATVKILGGLFNANPRTPPDAAAQAAIANLDRRLLATLTARRPEAVLAELAQHGILEGPLLSEEGKEYAASVLVELRKLLAPDAPVG